MTLLFVFYLTASLTCHANAFRDAIIKHPNAPMPFRVIVSEYSSNTIDLSKSTKGKLIYHSSDTKGCSKWQSINKNENTDINNESILFNIGIVDRGDCTFLEKSKQAQLAGLDIILIASNDEIMSAMGADENDLNEYIKTYNNVILSIMVPQSFKTFITSENYDNNEIEILKYKTIKTLDISMFIMIFVSTLLVGIGAYYSSDIERSKMYNLNANIGHGFRRRAPIQEINTKMAWSFILLASSGLLMLYFFVDKIFIIIVIIFCIGATNGLSTIFSHVIDYFIPNLQSTQYFIKQLDLEFTLSDLLGFIPAIIITLIWFLIRQTNDFAWILQNIMCVGLLLILQRTIRLTNLKISSILLCTAFLYDIFWVFISPLIFESSVMVAVATYQHKNNHNDTLPVVIKFPRVNDIFHSPMILGLGDIALPGLLISYLLRYDYINKIGIINIKNNIKYGYFIVGIIGYAIGMLFTDINLILMQSGQPALLFLVPCTLGTTIIISYKRGHLKQIWNGISIQNKINKSPIPERENFILRDSINNN
eukprot:474340_1